MGIEIPVGSAQTSQEFLLTGADHPFYVTLGITPGFGATAESIANSMRTAWFSEVWSASNRGTNWAMGKHRVEFCTAPGVIEIYTVEAINAGTVTPNTNPPPNTALLVRKSTGLGGRRNQGRMFVPGFLFAEGNVSDVGLFDSGTLGVLQGWFDDFQSAIVADDNNPVLLHSDGGPATPITSFVCQQKVASQRLRLRS